MTKAAYQVAIWTRKETGAEIVVCIVGRKTGFEGEPRFIVCKGDAPTPYVFNVRADEVRAA